MGLTHTRCGRGDGCSVSQYNIDRFDFEPGGEGASRGQEKGYGSGQPARNVTNAG